ncbi:MAG TPA: MetQ/NlpA family ABC transporter substrate-binding protein [Gammaproteobacteria bacterium]|nr:MetQ/NlpA family ABC transporter substrate-binding protein [Gammaproteobacteria bacterium]
MKLIKLCAVMIISVGLTACGKSEPESQVFKVGTVAGPETQLMEMARDVALKESGVKFEIVTFEDYVLPNTALADGLIDANAMQTEHYFDQMLAATGYPLARAGYTFIYPVGIYSSKHKTINDLGQAARIAIPNDASNEPRSLLVLAQAGLITLNDTPTGADFSTVDIKDNPLQLDIITIDAAQLPRMLGDVDAAVINTNYALPAGLLPNRDAIFVEKVNPLYANIIAVRKGHEKDPQVEALVQAYQSDAVVALAEKLFEGQAIPAWEQLQ